jgi:hypothetical protein
MYMMLYISIILLLGHLPFISTSLIKPFSILLLLVLSLIDLLIYYIIIDLFNSNSFIISNIYHNNSNNSNNSSNSNNSNCILFINNIIFIS